MRKEVRVGQVRLVIPEEVLERAMKDLQEENTKFRKMPAVVRGTDPDSTIPNPRAHQVKRLRYAERWRGSGAKPLQGTQVTTDLGITYNTAVTDVDSYLQWKKEQEVREAANNKVLGKE